MLKNNVCVLLASHNGEQFISEQLDSILKQVNVNVSIFISDDSSDDKTLEILKKYEKKNNNVFILSSVSGLGSASKNFLHLVKSVNLDKFDFVAFSDQDDIWHSNKLCISLELIDKLGLDFFSCDVDAFWPSGSSKTLKKSYPLKKFDYFFEAAGPGCTYVARTVVFESFKEFNFEHANIDLASIPHDWLFYAFCRSNHYKCHIHDTPLLLYRQHSTNVTGANFGWKAKIKRLTALLNGNFFETVDTLHSLFPESYLIYSGSRPSISNCLELRRQGLYSLIIYLLLSLTSRPSRSRKTR